MKMRVAGILKLICGWYLVVERLPHDVSWLRAFKFVFVSPNFSIHCLLALLKFAVFGKWASLFCDLHLKIFLVVK